MRRSTRRSINPDPRGKIVEIQNVQQTTFLETSFFSELTRDETFEKKYTTLLKSRKAESALGTACMFFAPSMASLKSMLLAQKSSFAARTAVPRAIPLQRHGSHDALWMPFTANKAFKETRVPKTVVRGKGMHFYDANDRAIMDTMGGLWCSAAGISPDPVGSISATVEANVVMRTSERQDVTESSLSRHNTESS